MPSASEFSVESSEVQEHGLWIGYLVRFLYIKQGE
jgi:hypothetical protein